jgi:hypothetical protein
MNPRDRWSQALRLAVMMLALSLVVPTRAAAYIDPMSGSILLQVLAAGFFATAFTVKRAWRGAAAGVRRRLPGRHDV